MSAPSNSHEAPAQLGLRNDDKQPKDEVESDQSRSLSDGDMDEYVVIKLSDVRKEFQCPICLGIIRKTRTVMECLHRFCRECIDKAMRLGNNECPACRTHCASRRSLRDDPNYDALISAIYPDIDKYEEEEFALREDEIMHNKQIQASIAQTRQRQSEALSRKRNARARAVAFARSQGNYRASHLRRRRNAAELQVFNDNEDMNDDDDDGGKDFYSGDEKTETMSEIGGVSNDNEDMNDNDVGKDLSSGDEKTETKPEIDGEQETQFPWSQESATIDADRTGDENIPDVNGDISSSGTLAWGKIGQRSIAQINDNNARSSRISRLIDHLRNSAVKDEELEIRLMLVSLDEQRIPSLQEPYLCCRPGLPVKILCKYVALKAGLLADQVELCLVGRPQVNVISGEGTVDPDKDKLRVLGDEETLAELFTRNATPHGHLILAYKIK